MTRRKLALIVVALVVVGAESFWTAQAQADAIPCGYWVPDCNCTCDVFPGCRENPGGVCSEICGGKGLSGPGPSFGGGGGGSGGGGRPGGGLPGPGDGSPTTGPSGGRLSPQYQVIDTSGWPMLGRTDPGSPTGGWIADPVVVDTGEMIFHSRDMRYPHNGALVAVDRLYRHQTENQGGVATDFGRNFHTNLRIVADRDTAFMPTTVRIHMGNGQTTSFTEDGSDYDPMTGSERYELEKRGGTQFVLTDQNGYKYLFEPDSDPTNLISTRNRYGEGENYAYDASGYVTGIDAAASGGDTTRITIERDPAHAITLIRDDADRSISYSYDASSNLTKVEDACGSCSTIPTAEYAYDGSNRITNIKDAYGNTIKTVAYDGSDRVTTSIDANGGTFSFEYNGTDLVIDPEGNSTEYTFNVDGLLTSKKYLMEAGGDDDILYTYEYDYNSNRVTSATLPNGAVVENDYDSRGRLLETIVTADSIAITPFSATYNSYGEILTEADGGGGSTGYAYDCSLSTYGGIEYIESGSNDVTRPNAAERSFAFAAAGLNTQHIDAVGYSHTYAYDTNGFKTLETVDAGALSLNTAYTVDAIGRVLTTTSPEGHQSIYAYNTGGQIASSTTPEGIETQYEYVSVRQTPSSIQPTVRSSCIRT